MAEEIRPAQAPRTPSSSPNPTRLVQRRMPGRAVSQGPGKRTPGIIPCQAADFESLWVVIPAMTGFLAHTNDRHPARACRARFTRTGQPGGGLLAAQPDAYLRPPGPS
jgi:hypothetical protein